MNSKDLLHEFQSTWPIDRLKKMELSEYTNADTKDNFIYWIVSKTHDLGSLGRIFPGNFGIHYVSKNKQGRPFKEKAYTSDGNYQWFTKLGENIDKIYTDVKSKIVKIAEASISNNFESINSIN